jgi:hypothetical protein
MGLLYMVVLPSAGVGVYVFGSSGRLRPALWSSEGGEREKWLDWNSTLVTYSEVLAHYHIVNSMTFLICTGDSVYSVACPSRK